MGDRAADAAAAWLTHDRDAGRDRGELARLDRLVTQIRDQVVAGAQLRPGHHVLDLGAGTGLLAAAAASQVTPGGTVTALDRSRAALAEVYLPRTCRVRRVAGDAHRIPLARACIDAVLTRSVLIYLDDLAAALHEVARVLRPGGRLSVFEPVNARRRHDADLAGMTVDEITAIDELRSQASLTAATMMAFTEARLIVAITAAGLDVQTVRTEQVTEQLDTHDAVHAYLHRRPHPGAHTPVELVNTHHGPAAAARYTTAWHDALDRAAGRGGITFITPVLYLTARAPTDRAT